MKRIYLSLSIALFIGVVACTKEKGLDNPSGGNTPGDEVPKTSHTSLESFFAATAAKPEKFTKDAGQFIQITTKEGTHFLIPGNALVDMMGNPVTGNVDIEIAEFNNPEAMILGNVGTVLADGALLESGGMYNIEVTKDGQPVRLAEGSGFEVVFPNAQSDMGAYIGVEGDDGTIQWEERADWMMSVDSSMVKKFFPDSFSFGNLDRLSKLPNPTDLTVLMDESDISNDTRVWLVFKDQRTVGYMPGENGNHATGQGYDIPAGVEMTLLAFSLKDGYLYFYDKTFIVKNNETIQLPAMQKISEADFKKKLKELNP